MELTDSEKKWLMKHGGRDEYDVLEDEEGKYVYMYHPNAPQKRQKYYIPKFSWE